MYFHPRIAFTSRYETLILVSILGGYREYKDMGRSTVYGKEDEGVKDADD